MRIEEINTTLSTTWAMKGQDHLQERKSKVNFFPFHCYKVQYLPGKVHISQGNILMDIHLVKLDTKPGPRRDQTLQAF